MRIVIDAREACRLQTTGKGMWSRHVIKGLIGQGLEPLLLIEENQTLPPSVHVPTKAFPGGWKWHVKASYYVQSLKAIDCYLSPTSYLVPWLLKEKVPCAIVIHDLIAFLPERHDWKAKLIERLTLPKVLKTARHILTVSQSTTLELLDRFPETNKKKITVVYEGPTIGVAARDERSHHPIEYGSEYILSVGTLCPRKNQLRLIHAYNMLPEHLRASCKLVLVGKRGWDDSDIVYLAAKSLNVDFRGYVPEDEVHSLFLRATIFAYPSLHEGFGLPVLDALTLGLPTVTSNTGSLLEIAGDAAVLVDPTDTRAISRALEQLILHIELRKALAEKGPKQASQFSWEKTVKLLLSALQ